MRNILIFVLVFIVCKNIVAQSFIVKFQGNQVNTDTIIFYGDVMADTLHIYVWEGDTTFYYKYEVVANFSVTNQSSEAKEVKIKKQHLKIVKGTENSMCWVTCYAPYTFETTKAVKIEGGQTSDNFSGHYKPFGNKGCSLVAYTFFDQVNPSDSARIVVKYIMDSCNPNSVNQELLSKKSGLLYWPNPCVDFLYLDVSLLNGLGGIVELFDLTGNRVKKFEVGKECGSIGLDIRECVAGNYLIRVSGNGNLEESGMLIIKP